MIIGPQIMIVSVHDDPKSTLSVAEKGAYKNELLNRGKDISLVTKKVLISQ